MVRTLSDHGVLSLKLDAESQSVNELKDLIERHSGIPVETQQLFHHGRLLKDRRRLSKYHVDEMTTSDRPILLLQKFKAKIVCSHKVMSLYRLTMDHHVKRLHPKQQIDCVSTTTVGALLEQLNLSHLSHLLKICVGSGRQEVKSITAMDTKLLDVPHLMDEGDVPTLSVLFSARWFYLRQSDVSNFHPLIAEVIEKSVNAAKALNGCTTFAQLHHQFEGTQSNVLALFDSVNAEIHDQALDIGRAWKWFNDVMEDNVCPQVHRLETYLDDESPESKIDDESIELLRQLKAKTEGIAMALKQVQDKWTAKRTQIVQYLQKTVKRIETALMAEYKNWISSDIVQWLQYMDQRIVLSDHTLKQMLCLNGQNIGEINDLSLRLMGIDELEIRALVMDYVDALRVK